MSRPGSRRSASRGDARRALLAVVIADHTHIAAERAATVRDTRQAHAARQAAAAIAGALVALEHLILPDRAARAAQRSRHSALPVPGTTTPVERAWVLGWHLLAATARLHHGASAAGRPSFGERETAHAIALTRRALSLLKPLVARERQLELRKTLAPAALTSDAQLRLFAPALAHGRLRQNPALRPGTA